MSELKSLDQIDRESFAAGPAPTSGAGRSIVLLRGAAEHPDGPNCISLDTGWDMVEGGDARDRLSSAWADTIPAAVPGSVQTALLKAGRIPDPYVGRNDEIARGESFKTWWLRHSNGRRNRAANGWFSAASAIPAPSGSTVKSWVNTKACSPN